MTLVVLLTTNSNNRLSAVRLGPVLLPGPGPERLRLLQDARAVETIDKLSSDIEVCIANIDNDD
eukprot:5260082-Heterocapsa_arctica.AAC.1